MTDDSGKPHKYFDLQVNGYAGIDFNDDHLTTKDLHYACQRLRGDGVDQILATVITDDAERMAGRLSNIARACDANKIIRDVICGIHIEGPFLNPSDSTVGAHPQAFVAPPDQQVMCKLLDAADGLTRLVTLAPECDEGLKLTRFLVGQRIVVSAGHCDPTRDELAAAADAGLSMFTHVGNGCARQMDRHDNIVQRVLSLADRIWCCFIADGIHIPPFALANYLKVAGIDRSIIVTDAMAAAGLGPGQYKIGSVNVEVDEQNRALLADSDGRLAGSVATMPFVQEVLETQIALSASDAKKMLFDNPKKAIAAGH
jgi:N-acetylglucosamine-6-phosphate deacetylase